MTDIVERLNDSLSAGYSELRKEAAVEIMRLRAKIEAMERQDCSKQSMPAEVSREFVMDAIAQALGDAYDCTRVWSAWGYGTMSHDDFQLIAEDGDRLREIADAAIMAMGASAPKPCAQPAPSVPDGWLRAIDEALVVANIGVASTDDTYEQAKAKLDNLIGFHVDVATDPAVNGGWKLVPTNPTETFYQCFSAYDGTSYSNPFDYDDFVKDWREALAAAPEAKP